MSAQPIGKLHVSSRREWRRWLQAHHRKAPGIWLIFHKRHTGRASIPYEDAVQDALCFGWIDSLVRRLDDECYARKFTPRASGSRWSTANRRRYADAKARGLLTPAGLERPPTERSGDAPRPRDSTLPSYIEVRLRADRRAWEYFQRLAPSYRRAYIGWIDSAARESTRAERLREAVRLLAAHRKLGLK